MEYSPSISFAFWNIFSRIEKNENNIIQVLTNKNKIRRDRNEHIKTYSRRYCVIFRNNIFDSLCFWIPLKGGYRLITNFGIYIFLSSLSGNIHLCRLCLVKKIHYCKHLVCG